MICLALQGLALVAASEIAEGMRRLDQAATAALAGEVSDARIVEVICCNLIDACKRVRDVDRASEWCRRAVEISERFGDAEMFATCRTYYGEVLVWQGHWAEAERALTAACRDLAPMPGKAAGSLVRLAELRGRQGRRDEARTLLAEAGERLDAGLVEAAIALDEGNAGLAVERADRFLRRVGNSDPFTRVPALELLVRARAVTGDVPGATTAAEELGAIAELAGTRPLRAAALLASARGGR
jgi:tetratricopeptide (TPR) repeat protein